MSLYSSVFSACKEGFTEMKTKNIIRVWLAVVLMVFPEIARAITIQEEEELSREFMIADQRVLRDHTRFDHFELYQSDRR